MASRAPASTDSDCCDSLILVRVSRAVGKPRIWSEKETSKLTKAEAVRVAEFWHAAALRWMDWAKKLVRSPRNGWWGSDMERKLIGGELRWRRKKGPKVYPGRVREDARFERDTRREHLKPSVRRKLQDDE